jgi:EAL domain-containing protein (putative c-di-GMP-specific phosphodiesterase class I)
VLEVTESVALSDVQNGAERVSELRRAGFGIAIDDFGTGYSSLSQLHEMRADELKIDISFVRRLHEPSGLSLVQAIINLAQLFGLKTVAEGVEDAATAQKLRDLGVDYLQGYWFGKPMPQAEFLAWLESQPAHLLQA